MKSKSVYAKIVRSIPQWSCWLKISIGSGGRQLQSGNTTALYYLANVRLTCVHFLFTLWRPDMKHIYMYTYIYILYCYIYNISLGIDRLVDYKECRQSNTSFSARHFTFAKIPFTFSYKSHDYLNLHTQSQIHNKCAIGCNGNIWSLLEQQDVINHPRTLANATV